MYEMDRYGLEAMVLALPPLEMDPRPQSVAVEPTPSLPPPNPRRHHCRPRAPSFHRCRSGTRSMCDGARPASRCPDYFMEDLDDDEEDDEDFLWTE